MLLRSDFQARSSNDVQNRLQYLTSHITPIHYNVTNNEWYFQINQVNVFPKMIIGNLVFQNTNF